MRFDNLPLSVGDHEGWHIKNFPRDLVKSGNSTFASNLTFSPDDLLYVIELGFMSLVSDDGLQ
jgi:hypothetical protein